MQRPLFPYPAEAVWNGSGDPDQATSFHPSAPEPADRRPGGAAGPK